jgi:hypothetical protein
MCPRRSRQTRRSRRRALNPVMFRRLSRRCRRRLLPRFLRTYRRRSLL